MRSNTDIGWTITWDKIFGQNSSPLVTTVFVRKPQKCSCGLEKISIKMEIVLVLSEPSLQNDTWRWRFLNVLLPRNESHPGRCGTALCTALLTPCSWSSRLKNSKSSRWAATDLNSARHHRTLPCRRHLCSIIISTASQGSLYKSNDSGQSVARRCCYHVIDSTCTV